MPLLRQDTVIVVWGKGKLFRADCEYKGEKNTPSEGWNNEMLKRQEGMREVKT